MPYYYRGILACLAVAGVGFTIRALKTGLIYGKGSIPYRRDEDPGMFAFMVFGQFVGVIICLWLAAGYRQDDFLDLLGLSGFFG